MKEGKCMQFYCKIRGGNYCCYYCKDKCLDCCYNNPDRCNLYEEGEDDED